MLITKENIKELQKEQEIYVILDWFKIPRKGIFLGKIGINYLFTYDNTIIKIYEDSIESNNYIKGKQLYTTYESMCEGFRKLCLAGLDHFNNHQLKNNPIIVQRERLSEETVKCPDCKTPASYDVFFKHYKCMNDRCNKIFNRCDSPN